LTYRTALLSLAVVSLFCGVAGAGTIVAYVPVARTTPVEGSAAPGFGSGAWQADGTGQVEYYVTPAALFGYAIQVSDIASMSYWTNKSTDGSAVDWTAYIYTAMQASGNEGSFYHSRLNSEPYFTQSNATANTWHQWSTNDGVNLTMAFYDRRPKAATSVPIRTRFFPTCSPALIPGAAHPKHATIPMSTSAPSH
jgi:hypothetical protein